MNRILSPKSIVLTTATTPLILKGQGVCLFDVSGVPTVSLRFLSESKSKELVVQWTPTSVRGLLLPEHEPLVDAANTVGLCGKAGAYYWVSLDAHNRTILAGIGEARMETVIYRYTVPATCALLEDLTTVVVEPGVVPLRLLRDPVTHRMPLSVKEKADLTMDDVAAAAYLPKANLSIIAQKLHDCIAGPSFVLDDDGFPEFSAAIEASLANPHGWCYKRLAEKANEFGSHQPLETYLRITLGQNNGESPGIPYVMEIWPPGHSSPVHNHAGSHAVIRVLHGSIQVRLFPYLCCDVSGVPPHSVTSFSQGDVTWISPTLNQTHQLANVDSTTCVTIQCYMYDGQNRLHYDFFDYVDAHGVKQQYEPDSDMDFVAFKALMRKEWGAARADAACCRVC